MKPEKISTSVMSKNKLIIFASLIILSIPLIHSGCFYLDPEPSIPQIEHPDAVFNRSLSEQEMSLPFSQYRRDFIGERSIKVDLPSPQNKPEVQWSRKLKVFEFNQMIVDSQGGTWFIAFSQNREIYKSDEEYEKWRNSKPRSFKTLVRLNPDNSISWKRDFLGLDQEYTPAIICDGAVVWLVKTFNMPDSIAEEIQIYFDTLKSEISLECIDNDGNTVWRTQTDIVGSENFHSERVWRISENRIMLQVWQDNSGIFNIYSLSNGSLIKTLKFPEWHSSKDRLKPHQPIELPDNGWIGFQKDGIVRFDSNLKTVWKYNIAIDEIRSQPVILGGKLIFSTPKYLSSLDLDTGKVIWHRDEYSNTKIHGAETDSEIFFFRTTSQSEPCWFIAMDRKGASIFSTTYNKQKYESRNKFNHTIVYEDGSVLFNDRDSLDLFDEDGLLIWSLSLTDLGFSAEMYTMEDSLYYAPDGRLLVCVTTDDFKADMNDYIISLETNN